LCLLLPSLSPAAGRIVAIPPHAVEILYAIGVGSELVGVGNHSDFPEAATRLPQVGGYDGPHVEAVLRLDPTLVIVWDLNQPTARKLQALGIEVVASNPDSLDAVWMEPARLGGLTGHLDEGRNLSHRLLARWQALTEQVAATPEVSVFYQVWNDPLISVGQGSFIAQMIEGLRGRNILADSPVRSPQVSLETVLLRAPEVIVVSSMEQPDPSFLTPWRRYTDLPAVRDGRLFLIDPDLIHRPGPRLIEGAALLAKMLHPGQFGGAP